jgi:hypothetical protein
MKYNLIQNQDDFDYFLKRFHFVEDALIKMVSIQNRSYVDSDYRMFGNGDDLLTVRILFQTQWEDIPVVEILCEDVAQFAMEKNYVVGLYGQVKPDSFTLYFDDRKNLSNGIRGRTVKYRELSESFLGKDSRLDESVPEESELFAEVPKAYQKQNIQWLAIWKEDKGGIFVFQFEDLTKPSLYDDWFQTVEEALECCKDRYNIQRNDWMTREELHKRGIEPYPIK